MRQRAADSCCMVGKRYGNYLFILYMVVKFCYIAIALFQLYGLNYVIGNGNYLPLFNFIFLSVTNCLYVPLMAFAAEFLAPTLTLCPSLYLCIFVVGAVFHTRYDHTPCKMRSRIKALGNFIHRCLHAYRFQ